MIVMKKSVVLLFTAAALAAQAAPSAPKNRVPQGGGVIYPAWTGEYWANPTMQGKPDYTRSDIRVRFDWQDWQPILGVHAESVRNFPTDRFSARWTGKIIARFNEDYTFRLTSDEQARIQIKPEGSSEWKTLIDAWAPHKRRDDTATMALKPGVNYDVVIDYAEGTGDAVCSLYWSSPSTPEEIVDYVSGNGVHFTIPEVLANLFSFSGQPREAVGPANSAGGNTDSNGWPTADFSTALIQGYTFYVGRGMIVFKGQADVSMGNATFEVDGKSYPTLPKGVGYNPKSNETRAFVIWTESKGENLTTSVISMKNTQRTPGSPVGSGVTDLEVMCPRHVNGTEPQEPGEIISQEARDTYLPVYMFRDQKTGLNDIVKWDERTLPAYSKIQGQIWRSDIAYEKLILAANEIGRDIHLNFGGSIDEEFMYKLALLFKYGSDGKEPYTKPTPNPVWPPLSPNLRLYLEHGNEMGWSAIQPRAWSQDFERLCKEKGEIYNILNFDGNIKTGGIYRYHAYRTVRMSENMRKVWGDAAMGDRIRVLLFGQYANWCQEGMCQFINDYYNNPAFVKTPRPVSEILFAAGPAIYYGTINNFCTGDKVYIKNCNFEETQIKPGEAKIAPVSKGWKFEGGTGVVDLKTTRLEAVTAMQPSGSLKIVGKAAAGFQFTVGDKDLFVYEVGRIAQKGEKGKAATTIVMLNGNPVAGSKHPATELEKVKAGEISYTTLEYCGWATSDSSRIGVWRLEAGKTYALITDVNNVDLPSADSQLTSGNGIKIDGGVLIQGATISIRGISQKVEKVSGSGTGFPIVNFRYAFAQEPATGMAIAPSDPMLDPTWSKGGKGKSFIPDSHRNISKAAFIAGKGKLSTTVTIDKKGEYALIFTANGSLNKPGTRDGDLPFTITIGGKQVWSDTVGESRKPNGGVFQWGTDYLTLEPGEHEIVFESTKNSPKDTVYIYAMHLGNLENYYGGPGAPNFLGAGAATGQTDSGFEYNTKVATSMAQLWGLVPYAYEGGTQAGGDWNGGKLNYPDQFKWNHPMSKVADNNWANLWHNYGGADAMYYYPGFEYRYMYKAETFMPWSASIDRAHTWVLEPKGPVAAPTIFKVEVPHFQGEPNSTWAGWLHPWSSNYSKNDKGATLTQNQWKGFIFRAPKTGEYTITAKTSGGGKVKLFVNDSQSIVEGASGTPVETKVHLTQGIHSVRVLNTDGSFAFQSLEVK
jgi:hypothetical protein